MNKHSEERKGELYIFLGSALWSLFPVITILSYSKIPSLYSLAWSTFFSAVFFTIVVLARRTLHELKNWLVWKYSFFVVLIISVLFYGLYFIGLEKTSAGNASIIALFEVFASFFLFNVVKKEFFSPSHIAGSLLMIAGAIIVLLPNYQGVHSGDFIILTATFFPPLGNHFQQKIRRIVSSETAMFLRSLIATPILFFLAYLFHQYTSIENVKSSLFFLLINGFLLLGLSKVFWLEAIHRISVTKGVALSSINPFLTLLIAWIILKEVPNAWQLISLIPMVLGVLLLTDQLGGGSVKKSEETYGIDAGA